MTSEKRAQKFHADDLSLPRLDSASDCLEFSSSSHKQIPKSGGDASSVWNFCARFSDVITRGNQSWRHEMSAVFSGYDYTKLVEDTGYESW